MAKLLLNAGDRERVQTIVSIPLPAGSDLKDGPVALKCLTTGAGLVGQVDEGVLTFIIPYLPAGMKGEMDVSNIEAAPDNVSLEKKRHEIDVKIGGDYFTTYRFPPEFAKPCMAPLVGPFGDEVTRSIDPSVTEHPHHRGIFLAHGAVNGEEIWNEPKDRHGFCVQTGLTACNSGPVFAKIVTENMWKSRDRKDLMAETRTWKIYNTPKSLRVIDVRLELRGEPGEVILGATKEAGFLGIRMHPNMNADAGTGGRLENCYGGVSESECWSYKSQWCDYSGLVNGNRVGIAAFDHPENLRFPTRWHIRGYGLFAANPWFWDGEHRIPAGGKLVFRYRVIVHAGDARAADVATKYLEWEQGLKAKLEG
ncbi:MAG TPA: PmoA family protein [Candidatus Brocadiia bacterium]|nr:PmoA family protein [Candidatus Brocadiia bacterium]